MKKAFAVMLCLLVTSASTLAQGNQFQVRYVGGSLSSTVKPDDWHNDITVTPEVIIVKLRDGQELKINPTDVRVITHGRHASRRIGTYATVAILTLSPIFLLGMIKKNKRNFVGIAFEKDGKKQAVNLQVRNGTYRGLLTALEGVTGVKTEEEVEEKSKKDKDQKSK